MRQRAPRIDPRDLPVYTIPDAAHYLRVPASTLKTWVHGRVYNTAHGAKYAKPLILPPGSSHPVLLSFFNVVAIVYHRVLLFVLTRQDMKGEHMGRLLVAALPKMRKIIAKFDAPFIAQIARSGLITGPMTEKRIVEIVKEKHGISI